MPSLNYTSCIGEPTKICGDEILENQYFSLFKTKILSAGYYSKGSVIYGVTLQDNEFFKHKQDFFVQYQLYENFNGWNVPGKIHPHNGKLLKESDWYTGYTQNPILVGDIYGHFAKTVIWSTGYYDDSFGLFKVRFQVGVIPTFVYPVRENIFNQELRSLQILIKEGFDVVEESFGQFKGMFSIENVGAPTQGWVTPPTSLFINTKIQTLQANIKNSSTKIQQQIEKIKEAEW